MSVTKEEAYILIGKYFAKELVDKRPYQAYGNPEADDQYWYSPMRGSGDRIGGDRYICVSKETGDVSVIEVGE